MRHQNKLLLKKARWYFTNPVTPFHVICNLSALAPLPPINPTLWRQLLMQPQIGATIHNSCCRTANACDSKSSLFYIKFNAQDLFSSVNLLPCPHRKSPPPPLEEKQSSSLNCDEDRAGSSSSNCVLYDRCYTHYSIGIPSTYQSSSLLSYEWFVIWMVLVVSLSRLVMLVSPPDPWAHTFID